MIQRYSKTVFALAVVAGIWSSGGHAASVQSSDSSSSLMGEDLIADDYPSGTAWGETQSNLIDDHFLFADDISFQF